MVGISTHNFLTKVKFIHFFGFIRNAHIFIDANEKSMSKIPEAFFAGFSGITQRDEVIHNLLFIHSYPWNVLVRFLHTPGHAANNLFQMTFFLYDDRS